MANNPTYHEHESTWEIPIHGANFAELMRLWLRIILAIAVIVSVVVVAGVAYFVWVWTHDSILESHGAVTREQARRDCPIPLPASAHAVQYSWIVGGLQYTFQFVRFEAPATECFAHAQLLFAENAAHNLRYRTPIFLPVSHPAPPGCSELHTEWFDTQNIVDGMAAGNGPGHGPQIWIDTKRGVFYYYVTD